MPKAGFHHSEETRKKLSIASTGKRVTEETKRKLSDLNRVRYKDVNERFWSKVDIKGEDECWEWKACCFPEGYGKFQFRKNAVVSHRVAWILSYGEIPEGMNVLHTCDNRKCCNKKNIYF